jgi:hypothetical protein
MSETLLFKMFKKTVSTHCWSHDILETTNEYDKYRTPIQLNFKKTTNYKRCILRPSSYSKKSNSEKYNYYLYFYNLILNELIKNKDNLNFKIHISEDNEDIFEHIISVFSAEDVTFEEKYNINMRKVSSWLSGKYTVEEKEKYYIVDFTNYKFLIDMLYEVNYIESKINDEQKQYHQFLNN